MWSEYSREIWLLLKTTKKKLRKWVCPLKRVCVRVAENERERRDEIKRRRKWNKPMDSWLFVVLTVSKIGILRENKTEKYEKIKSRQNKFIVDFLDTANENFFLFAIEWLRYCVRYIPSLYPIPTKRITLWYTFPISLSIIFIPHTPHSTRLYSFDLHLVRNFSLVKDFPMNHSS